MTGMVQSQPVDDAGSPIEPPVGAFTHHACKVLAAAHRHPVQPFRHRRAVE